MEILIETKFVPDDYVAAQQLHFGARRFLLMGSFTLALITFMTLSSGRSSEVNSWLFGAAAWIVCLIAFLIFWPRWVAMKATKIFRQQKSLQVQSECRITEDFYSIKSEFGEGKFAWGDFHKWKANDKLILVYSSDSLFHMFPRRWMATDADYDAFKALLARAIGPEGKPRR